MHPNKHSRPKTKKQGIALLQLLGAIVLIGIIVAIAIPLIGKAKATAQENAANAAVTMLNGAANRARLDGLSGAGTTGTDKAAAIAWYKAQSYIPQEKNPDTSRLSYLAGTWFKDPWADTPGGMMAEISKPLLTDEDKLNHLATSYGYSNIDDLLQNYYGVPDLQTLLDDYSASSVDDFLQNDTYIGNPSAVYDISSLYGNPDKINAYLANLPNLSTETLQNTAYQLTYWANDPNSGTDPNKLIAAITALQTQGNPNLDPNDTWTIPGLATSTVQNILWGGNPNQIDLSGLNLTNGTLGSIVYNGSTLTPQQLTQLAGLYATNLSGANLAGVNPDTQSYWAKSWWANSLTNTNLSGANFSYMGFYANNLTGANLSGANLSHASAFQNNFSGANFTGANLIGASIYSSDFSGAIGLTGAMLNSADYNLQNVNLTGLNLSGFNASTKALGGANFTNVTGITGSNLSGASSYQYANFTGLNLAGFNPNKQSLNHVTMPTNAQYPASFQTVTGLSNAQLKGTQWTDGSYPWGQ